MKINLIAVGSLNKETKILFKDYVKKLSFYAELRISEVKPILDKNIEIIKQKETKIIKSLINKNSRVILCSLNGETMTSKKFSEKYSNIDNLTFIIGGSYGVEETQFNEKICFSKMTFPHQLFRVFLVEQLFRAHSIKNNSKYHK
ncbi:MAG: 23S rRNA (pseudouridine(1915)-N(3))-methyltransferase RlmH [Mycoplasma sp.]|nr:23S rRNA (pseudouridine(1915)-N(3))-methyltransferase RlmH [Mycoplasma sp.]